MAAIDTRKAKNSGHPIPHAASPDGGSTCEPVTDSVLTRSSAHPELPARIGRFEVRWWVGDGSFADVYLGYDPNLDREVALKVARPGTLGTPRHVKRFLREAGRRVT